MLSGKTILIAHLGFPTEAFKAPYIYNPWFDAKGIDAAVVPMGVTVEDYPVSMSRILRCSNVRGALVTMPHKITTLGLVDAASKNAQVAGAVNAILKRPDGSLFGDMFDGAGFVRGLERKAFRFSGARCLLVGAGGVGSAIAASLAERGVAGIALHDLRSASADSLAERLRQHYPQVEVRVAANDPAGFDLVVNCSPLGMSPGDPLPVDISRLSPETFAGEVVMKQEVTPWLQAARARGCPYLLGVDMLFEMIPAYLEFFGFGFATADELRGVAKISY